MNEYFHEESLDRSAKMLECVADILRAISYHATDLNKADILKCLEEARERLDEQLS